jgi:hypothetical protein
MSVGVRSAASHAPVLYNAWLDLGGVCVNRLKPLQVVAV